MRYIFEKLVLTGDASIFGALFICVFGTVMYLSASYINSGYRPNHEYDIVRKKHIDRTVYNSTTLIVCTLLGLCAFFFLTIGLLSLSGHTARAYNEGVNEMTRAIDDNIDASFGGRENRIKLNEDIEALGISEFSLEKAKDFNAEQFTDEFISKNAGQ